MNTMSAHLGETRRLKMRSPFVTAHATYTHREVCVLRLSHGAHTGLGELAPLPGFSHESLTEARRELGAIVPALGRMTAPETLDDVRAVMSLLRLEAPSARFALETALMDLCARRRGERLSALLGGTLERVQVNATIGAATAPACFACATELSARGFRCFKLKVGARTLAEDIQRTRAVRDAIGDAATLRLDANGAWSVPQAMEALEALARFDLTLVEQPVASLEDMATVHAHTNVRLGADESIRSVEDARRAIAMGAADVLVLKPALLGGALVAAEVETLATQANLTVIYTTLLEGAVGRTAALHAAAASRVLEGPCGLATASLLEEDLTKTFPRAHDGLLTLPDAPGLGVEVEPDAHAQRFPGDDRVPLPLAHRARWEPARTALETPKRTWTYEALYEDARRLADGLAARGISSGSRVGVWAKNSGQLVALIHALGMREAVFVALHPRWTDAEATDAARRAHCALVVHEGQDAAWGAPNVSLDALWDEQVERVEHATRVDLGAPMALLFTSGTTGTPKMAVLTWRNLMFSATGSAIRLGHLPEDRWLDVLPMCHIAGLSIVTRCALLGTTVVAHPAYRAEDVARALADGEVTMVSLVSRQLEQVLDALGERAMSPRVRVVLLGGGPIPASLLERCRERGVPVRATYGMTEASSQVATARSPETEGVGGPLVWTEVALRGEHDEEGEVWVRGPTVSPGYVAFETSGRAHWPVPEGWFGTGDWAGLGPSGGLRILDRRTDLIVTGGENVYPAEVERVLQAHPDIQSASVVGIPDETWGHRLVAALVARDAAAVPSDQAIDAWCRDHLAGFKVPRELRWWDDLPRGGLEKVSRREVRRRWQTLT